MHWGIFIVDEKSYKLQLLGQTDIERNFNVYFDTSGKVTVFTYLVF
jgi:hypothetical protein